MRLPVLAAALSLLTAPAMAADCAVTVHVNNLSNHQWVSVLIDTRTRANPVWYTGGLAGATDRAISVAPGARTTRTMRMPVFGCSVRRELRAIQTCRRDGTTTSERVLQPWGAGYQLPREIIIDARC